jgi:cytidine deaminase
MQLGESYRGFIVGAAALAIDRSGTKTGIYVDGNYTPFEGAEWNCAEKRLLEKVEERGFERIEAIAVSGPFQPDGESLLMSPTLHPCGRCRRRLQASPLTHPNTLIASVNLSETRYELFTIESLSKFHETGEPQPFPVYHPALEQYWRLALEFDRADELREQRILEGIAEIIHGQNI